MIRETHAIMENAKIISCKLTGKGPHYFDVYLNESTAIQFIKEDWDVWSGTESHLRVYIDYAKRPHIYLVTNKSKSPMPIGLDVLDTLSYIGSDLSNVDLIMRPYEFKEGDTSKKACVKTMYITVDEAPKFITELK